MMPTITLPIDLAMSFRGDISTYSLYREQTFHVGLVLIPTTSLTVLSTLQRPYNEEHADTIKSMYSNQLDVRSTHPIECVVPLDSKSLIVNWLQNQDQGKLSKLNTADLLILDIPEVQFPIVKGQHRYEAYRLLLNEGGVLPNDAPHPECLAVRLFYPGAYLTYNICLMLMIVDRSRRP
jgi:hypothetical protein